MKLAFDAKLRDEYRVLFRACQVDSKRKEEVEHSITTVLRGGKRYSAVAAQIGLPWYFVGILHLMECGADFRLHLHNGDPLASRTVQVPKGRPEGEWPIPGASADELWQVSALDALKLDGLHQWGCWTIDGMMYCFERYNGFGYRQHKINSPYLFAASNHYTAGKYASDGKWSETAVSKQVGAAVILRRMVDQALVEVQQG